MDFIADAILLIGDKIGHLFGWILTKGFGATLDVIGDMLKKALGISKNASSGAYQGSNGSDMLAKDMASFNQITAAIKATGKAAWANFIAPLDKNQAAYLEYQTQVKNLKSAFAGSFDNLKQGLSGLKMPDIPYGMKNLALGGPKMTPHGLAWIQPPRSVEVNNNITLTAPWGSSKEQEIYFTKEMEKIAADSMSQAAEGLLIKNKGVQ
jgi:hypothetical protein